MKYILLTISLIFGATTESAADNSPTATEILEDGMILHKEVYRDDAELFLQIDYLVVYDDKYFFCVANYKALGCDQKIVSPSGIIDPDDPLGLFKD